jgi:hypothetical protein
LGRAFLLPAHSILNLRAVQAIKSNQAISNQAKSIQAKRLIARVPHHFILLQPAMGASD